MLEGVLRACKALLHVGGGLWEWFESEDGVEVLEGLVFFGCACDGDYDFEGVLLAALVGFEGALEGDEGKF